MKDVKGKVAFITGGASGMGLGMAKVFANNGMKVLIVDKRRDALDKAMEYFKKTAQPVQPIQLDVTDREAYAKAADKAEEIFGKVHVLVNNAGVGTGGYVAINPNEPEGQSMMPKRYSTFKDWDFGMSVNIGGVINGIVIFVPRILKHGEGGHIVSTSSSAGFSAIPGNAIYSTAKFAVAGLMETLSSELEGANVGASVYFPGPVKDTELGISSMQNRPDHLKNEGEPEFKIPSSKNGAPQGPPVFDTTGFMDPLEVGEYVLRGIKRDDLFIISHPDFREGIKARCDALIRAIPDEEDDPVRREALFKFGPLLHNHRYDRQTTPGPPEWRRKK